MKYLAAGTAGALAAVALQATPALANSETVITTYYSVWAASGATFTETHSGDDIGVNIVTNIDLDVRWETCSGSQTGSTYHLWGSGQGAVKIGNGFRAGTCLRVWTRTRDGSSGGDLRYGAYWNYNIS